jgi:hypothetical protein
MHIRKAQQASCLKQIYIDIPAAHGAGNMDASANRWGGGKG